MPQLPHGLTLGSLSNRSLSSLDPRALIFIWIITCLTNKIVSRFMMRRPCGSLRSHSTVWWSSTHLSLFVSTLYIQQYLSTLFNVFPFLWQSGVWVTSWSWQPFSAPLRWGQPGMSSSGTSPSLTSVCVLWPCPWPWWVRTFQDNLVSQMRLAADPSDQFSKIHLSLTLTFYNVISTANWSHRLTDLLMRQPALSGK